MLLWILLGILVFLAAATMLIAYLCFRMGFYAPRKKKADSDAIETPEGAIYDPYRPKMEQWVREARQLPRQHFTVQSFDGLTLHGDFFEYAPGAPMELMFHGYRGSAERDLSGGVQRCFKIGRSVLLVDQRCSCRSEGDVITFGIKEHRDCLTWVNFLVDHFGPDVKIILTGISMGGATVLTASGCDLPENVIGILADCPYSSPKEIICKVIKDMGLPPKIFYPFTKLSARIFGKFDLEETSPLEGVKNCRIPVIFFHGESDDFVPCDMSRELFEACASKKKLVTIPGAGHGLSYAVDPEKYLTSLREFFGEEASYKK